MAKVEFGGAQGRDDGAAAGRPQPRPAPRLLPRRWSARRARRFPQVTPHFFTASEIRTMAEVAGKSMPERPGPPQGGGPAHPARRRRRGAVRARAQAHRAQEGRAGGVARRAPRGAPPGIQVDGDDDVRPRREAGRHPRSPRRDPRPARRARRVHRLRAVVVQARQHAAREVDQAVQGPERLPADAGRLAPLSRQLPPRAGVVVLGGQAGRPGRAALRAPTTSAARSSRRTSTRPPTTSTRPRSTRSSR